jgi:hypothetical protein
MRSIVRSIIQWIEKKKKKKKKGTKGFKIGDGKQIIDILLPIL